MSETLGNAAFSFPVPEFVASSAGSNFSNFMNESQWSLLPPVKFDRDINEPSKIKVFQDLPLPGDSFVVPSDDDVVLDRGGIHHNNHAKRLFQQSEEYINGYLSAGGLDSTKKLTKDCVTIYKLFVHSAVLDEMTIMLVDHPLWFGKTPPSTRKFVSLKRDDWPTTNMPTRG